MKMHANMDGWKIVGWACVAGWLGTSPLWADGFRNPPPSAEGLGLVGARYTLIDDSSAAAYNPANLTEVEQAETLLSITAARSDKKFTDAAGQQAKVKETWYTMPDLYTALPLENGLVAGLALTTPYGQATEFEKTSPLRYTAPYFAEMRAINLNPTLAKRINDRLDVAIGLDVMWSDLDLRQVFPWSIATGNPLAPDGSIKFEGDGVGVGGNAGLTWRFAEKQRVALVYRSAMDIDYEGDTTVSGAPAGVPVAPRSDFESTIKFPNSIGFGYGVDVTDRLSIGVDVEWFEWSRYQELTLDAGANAALLPVATTPQNWKDTWNFGVGGDYRLNEAWTARAGYIYLETPVPDSTMLPVLAENDQHVITIGLGYHQGAHRVDVAYGLGIYDDRKIDNNQNPAYNGTYELSSQLASVSYGFSF